MPSPTMAAPAVRPAAPMARTPGPSRPATRPPMGVPDVPLDDRTMLMPGAVGSRVVVVAWLVVARGAELGRDFRLPPGTARIGSDANCDIRLGGDTYVSGHHVELSFHQGQYELHDLNSTNGTFVNDVRVSDAVLRNGDRVRLGETHLVFSSLSL
ncbi:MAG: FHA domain-containing protein [bacterium]|nr:FHA domain-containing protein [bacterium]